MNLRPACAVVTAFIMLVIAAQADVVFGAIGGTSESVSQQSLATASWGVVAGVDSLATGTGSPLGPITPYSSGCTGIPTYYITIDSNGWDSAAQKVRFQSAGWDNAIAIGMTVTGVGIVNSGTNTITNVNAGNREITLAIGGNTSPIYSTLTIGVTTTSCCVTTDYYLTTDGAGWTDNGSNVATHIHSLQSVAVLSVGMTVTGPGIANSGTNTVTALRSSDNRITLATGPNTSPDFTTLKFSTPCPVDTNSQFLSIVNIGSINLISMSIQQTVTSTAGKSIKLQTCSTTWNEIANTCSGTITTIMTTIGSGSGANSPQTITWTRTITPGANVRLRALASAIGSTSTISVWATNSDIRSATNTNA